MTGRASRGCVPKGVLMHEAVAPPSRALVPRGEFGPFDALTDLCHGFYIRGFS